MNIIDYHVQAAIALLGLFVVFCGGVARMLPAGKLQRVFAWLGAFVLPKTNPAAIDRTYERTLEALGNSLTSDQLSRVIAAVDVNALSRSQYDALVAAIVKNNSWARPFDPDETLPASASPRA